MCIYMYIYNPQSMSRASPEYPQSNPRHFPEHPQSIPGATEYQDSLFQNRVGGLREAFPNIRGLPIWDLPYWQFPYRELPYCGFPYWDLPYWDIPFFVVTEKLPLLRNISLRHLEATAAQKYLAIIREAFPNIRGLPIQRYPCSSNRSQCNPYTSNRSN